MEQPVVFRPTIIDEAIRNVVRKGRERLNTSKIGGRDIIAIDVLRERIRTFMRSTALSKDAPGYDASPDSWERAGWTRRVLTEGVFYQASLPTEPNENFRHVPKTLIGKLCRLLFR